MKKNKNKKLKKGLKILRSNIWRLDGGFCDLSNDLVYRGKLSQKQRRLIIDLINKELLEYSWEGNKEYLFVPGNIRYRIRWINRYIRTL